MLKYLLLLVLLLIVWWAWKKRAGDDSGGNDAPPRTPERMVRCAHCGVHLPESDAVVDGDVHFCNEAHRRAGRHSGD